jgi:hypothetical protein
MLLADHHDGVGARYRSAVANRQFKSVRAFLAPFSDSVALSPNKRLELKPSGKSLWDPNERLPDYSHSGSDVQVGA